MKVLLISTSDIKGGAAIAAYRLHKGLRNIGADSQMLVQVKFSNDIDIIATETKMVQKFPKLRPHLDSLPKVFFMPFDKNMRTSYSLQWLPSSIISKVSELAPDIINLHWVSGGIINIETIAKLNKPIVWTLHDMWPFTGGCHYTQECDRYQESCGNCPQMPTRFNLDLSRWVWQRKAKAWTDLNATIVSPSRWLADCATSSSLFRDWRIEVIPNGLDTEIYKPIDRSYARDTLKLPQDKRLILFGASDLYNTQRKGFHLLKSALESVSKTNWSSQCEVVIFGTAESNHDLDLGFKTYHLGALTSEILLALAYSAADVLVTPSLQDNLPNTVMESLACGTPCVAFNIGGMSDMIDHQQNGYLAKPYETCDLAQGIVWVIEDDHRLRSLSHRASQKAEQSFTSKVQADKYLRLYNSLI